MSSVSAYLLPTRQALTIAVALIIVIVLLQSHIASVRQPVTASSASAYGTHSRLNHNGAHISHSLHTTASSARAPASEQVEVYPLITPHPTHSHPHDTTGELYDITRAQNRVNVDDYLLYQICSFTNVCLSESQLLLNFHSADVYDYWKKQVSACQNNIRGTRDNAPKYDLCHCFYPQFMVAMMPADQTVTPTLMHSPDPSNAPPASYNAGRPTVPTPANQSVSSWENTQLSAINTATGQFDHLMPQNVPIALPALWTSSAPTTNIHSGHWWGIHKYVNIPHIAHWAQRVVLLSAIYQHAASIPLPSLYGFIAIDTARPLPPHFEAILNITEYALLAHMPHTYQLLMALEHGHGSQTGIMSELDTAAANTASTRRIVKPTAPPLIMADDLTHLTAVPPSYTCFERVTFLKAFGIFSTNNHDTMAFRATAYKMYGLSGLSHRCPPRRVTLLYRDSRKVTNMQAIADYILSEYGKVAHLATINETSTPREQITLFAESGLLLSAHSSQLVNVMFSHPRSAMIEIAAEYYNSDFSEYAHGMGVYFQYALGGTVPFGQAVPAGMRDCINILQTCRGDSHCILMKRFECKTRNVCCKNLEFAADMEQVKVALRNAIDHLNWACGEVW